MTARTIRSRLRAATGLALLAAGALAAPAGATETLPRFQTQHFSHVSGTTAQLEGTVTPNGYATSYFFEWGPDAEPHGVFPNKSKPVAVPLPTFPATTVKVGQTATGLLAGYHYRIVGLYTNKSGEAKTYLAGEKIFENKQGKALKFVTSKEHGQRVTAVYGGSAELTGTLKGAASANHGLTLQATPFPFTDPFSTLAGTILTSRVGTFTFKVAHLLRSTEFRFVTIDPRPVYSPAVTVYVTPRITLHVRRGGTTNLYRLYGTVTPARPGAAVAIQQLLPQKATSKKEGPRAHSVATTVLKRLSSKESRFSVVVKLSGNFHYRAYVRLPKGPLESGNSANVLVKAPAGAPTKQKKKK